MWDEEINKKIKEAADQYHPAYDDTAWSDMEKMLDEHLPQKKNRRRIIYFILPILILAGLLFFVNYSKKTALILPVSKTAGTISLKDTREKSADQQIVDSPGVVANDAGKRYKNPATATDDKKMPSEETPLNSTAKNEAGFLASKTVKTINLNKQPVAKNSLLNHSAKKNLENTPSTETYAKSNPVVKNSAAEKINQLEKHASEEVASTSITGNNDLVKNTDTANAVKDDKVPTKSNEPTKPQNFKDGIATNKQKKAKKTFMQNFGIDLGAGPDISAVRLSKTGKITPTYGAGLSYSFTTKLTLRTGFYVAKKVYSVDNYEYHVPAGSTWSNYLQSVDANCKVYEIPLTLSYNFSKLKNHNWFVSAGLSSYFMKKESYIYFYKYPSGTTDNRSWSVSNKNKNYFSVMDFSAGYQYSFNKRLFFIAEPYVKMPLSGIGAGKIKLNSGGILFTVAVKPF